MAAWQQGPRTFQYRVAAVIVDQNRVLLHRAETDTFWSLPGGRVEFLEQASEALVREVHEETGADVKVDRLLWVVENFFHHKGQPHQELGFYFLASALPGSERLVQQETFEGRENLHPGGALRLFFRWFPLDPAVLDQLTIYPQFLHHSLTSLPDQVVHITNTHY